MAYQTGTAADLDALLGLLSTFLSGNGWTIDKTVAGSGDGASSELYVSKGSSYFSMQADIIGGSQYYHGQFQTIDNPQLRIWGNTGFNGANTVNQQPGSHQLDIGGGSTSVYCLVDWLFPNMTAYHFFTDPAKTYVHVVVETTANEFHHICFGLADKLGAYDGGEYVMSHFWQQINSQVDVPADFRHLVPFANGGNDGTKYHVFRCNIDGQEWKRLGYQTTAFTSIRAPWECSSQNIWLDALVYPDITYEHSQPNDYNGLGAFFRIPVGWAVRSPTFYTPLGHYEDVRAVNIKNIVPGATITLGSDQWLVFPWIEKKAPEVRDDLPNSGHGGIAYKIIP